MKRNIFIIINKTILLYFYTSVILIEDFSSFNWRKIFKINQRWIKWQEQDFNFY